MTFTKGLEDEAFKRVILSMPLSMRIAVGTDLKLLQEAFQLDVDLLKDRRAARWERERDSDRGYTIVGRDHGFFGDCTLDEASAIMGVARLSLRNRVSGGNEFSRLRYLVPGTAEDLVTCSRVSQSERTQRVWSPPHPAALESLLAYLRHPHGVNRLSQRTKTAA